MLSYADLANASIASFIAFANAARSSMGILSDGLACKVAANDSSAWVVTRTKAASGDK